MERVRAKFWVDTISTDEYENKILKMSACTSEEGDGKDFTPYTPWGNLEMGITGDVPAAEFFEEGEIYYVEFVKVKK
jgi:hypothetical protein